MLACHLLTFVTLGLVAAAGCSKGRDKVFPVTGKLLVSGQPAAGARVFFHPQAAADKPGVAKPLAVVGDDGSFQATTYVAGDGAAPGQYSITVVWPVRNIIDGEEIEGPDQLRGRFANPQQPAATIEVTSGPTIIPDINLK